MKHKIKQQNICKFIDQFFYLTDNSWGFFCNKNMGLKIKETNTHTHTFTNKKRNKDKS